MFNFIIAMYMKYKICRSVYETMALPKFYALLCLMAVTAYAHLDHDSIGLSENNCILIHFELL